jgi:type IV secretory pathway VirB10-like protein
MQTARNGAFAFGALALVACGGPEATPVATAPMVHATSTTAPPAKEPEPAPPPAQGAEGPPPPPAPARTAASSMLAPSRASAAAASMPSPGDPKGSWISGAPTTSSSQVSEADRVVEALRPKLRACWDEAVADGAKVSGMMTCGVRIAKSGKVAAVSVTRRSGLPAPLVECVVDVLRGAEFAKRADEGLIQVPVRFGTD